MENPMKKLAEFDPALARAVEISGYVAVSCALAFLLGDIRADAEGVRTVAALCLAPILAYVAKKKRDIDKIVSENTP